MAATAMDPVDIANILAQELLYQQVIAKKKPKISRDLCVDLFEKQATRTRTLAIFNNIPSFRTNSISEHSSVVARDMWYGSRS